MFYTGIGSRKTPRHICAAMTELAQVMQRCGYVLRSGGARGADEAFEKGAIDKLIYLPWPNFNDNKSPYHGVTQAAMDIAARHHPAWHRLNEHAKLLHTRNVYQVLGLDLKSKSDFVLCWTKGGKGEGGTGQAVRIARAYGIPVYDLAVWNITRLFQELTVVAADQRQNQQR